MNFKFIFNILKFIFNSFKKNKLRHVKTCKKVLLTIDFSDRIPGRSSGVGWPPNKMVDAGMVHEDSPFSVIVTKDHKWCGPFR
jgi:hypothetical protein